MAKKKSKVTSNIEANKITLQFSKFITKKDLESVYTDVRFAVSDLKSGYNVISDFSNTTLLYLNGLGVFRKIFKFILTNDSGEIIRVVQDNRIIHKQLLNLFLKMKGYKPIYASTVEEAEAKIKISEKRNGLRFYFEQHPVQFSLSGSNNQGKIINISTSGCAIMTSDTLPCVNDNLEILFNFEDKTRGSNEFKIRSRVVRSENDTFAVSFSVIDRKVKNDLWKYIVAAGE